MWPWCWLIQMVNDADAADPSRSVLHPGPERHRHHTEPLLPGGDRRERLPLEDMRALPRCAKAKAIASLPPSRPGGPHCTRVPPRGVMCRVPARVTALCRQLLAPTTWTIPQRHGPNHLGLWCNAAPRHARLGLLAMRPGRNGGFAVPHPQPDALCRAFVLSTGPSPPFLEIFEAALKHALSDRRSSPAGISVGRRSLRRARTARVLTGTAMLSGTWSRCRLTWLRARCQPRLFCCAVGCCARRYCLRCVHKASAASYAVQCCVLRVSCRLAFTAQFATAP